MIAPPGSTACMEHHGPVILAHDGIVLLQQMTVNARGDVRPAVPSCITQEQWMAQARNAFT